MCLCQGMQKCVILYHAEKSRVWASGRAHKKPSCARTEAFRAQVNNGNCSHARRYILIYCVDARSLCLAQGLSALHLAYYPSAQSRSQVFALVAFVLDYYICTLQHMCRWKRWCPAHCFR